MAPSNEIENVWKEGKAREADPAPLSGKDLQVIVSSRVRKEFKTVSEFVWAAIVYQIILYSFLTHTFIGHWGDVQIMLLCLAGGACYIPLTMALIRRIKTLFRHPSEAPGSPVPDVFRKVEGEYARLADFFQFKKRIIVLVTFTLFVKGGIEGNRLGSLVVFAVWVGLSQVAIHAENKKRFISPLRHLELLLDDLKHS
jgi:hypothetical protein